MQEVVGSTPTISTEIKKTHRKRWVFFVGANVLLALQLIEELAAVELRSLGKVCRDSIKKNPSTIANHENFLTYS